MDQTPPHAPGFRSLWDETSVDNLPVVGRIPKWLSGTLFRNGPGAWETPDRRTRVAHWFDGLGMLHRFGFDNGRVSYRNHFLRTQTHALFTEKSPTLREIGGFTRDTSGQLFGGEEATFAGGTSDNASVHVHPVAGKPVAFTETPTAVAFDPTTLERVDTFDFGGDQGINQGTAHQHLDPDTGELISYGLRFGRVSSYVLTSTPAGSRERRVIAEIETDRPSYIHDFSVTSNYIVLPEWPLRTSALRMLMVRNTEAGFFNGFAPDNDLPVRFHIIERETGQVVGVSEASTCFGFHDINAYEADDGTIVCDICVYDKLNVANDLLLSNLRTGVDSDNGRLVRYTLPVNGGRAKEETLFDNTFELPRIRESLCGKPYRYSYALSEPRQGPGFLDRIVKHDHETHETISWNEPFCFPGEPIFVTEPSTDATGEDDGVLLSVVLENRPDAEPRSFLLVLDAVDLQEIGRAITPHVVPFGFHGRYFA